MNETFVRKWIGGQDPIGRRVRLKYETGNDAWMTIVGVVGDVRSAGPAADVGPTIHMPYEQRTATYARYVMIAARTRGEPMAVAESVRRVVQKMDPDQPIFGVATVEELMRDSVNEQRFHTLLLGLFAAVATLLAMVGIYGVVSYVVSWRTREIGIRMALGAQRGEVQWMVVRQGMMPVAAGIAAGVLGALWLTRLIESMLFHVSPTDPVTIGSTVGLLAAVALAACWLPARRASRVEPMEVLRYE